MKFNFSTPNSHYKLSSLLLFMIVFMMPIWIKVVIILLPILLLAWILEGRWKGVYSNFTKNRYSQLIIFFWFLHLIGVLYSTNWRYGLEDVQQKLSLILFPLMFLGFSGDESISTKKILNIFLIGSVVSGVTFLSIALFNSFYFTSNGLIFNPAPPDAPYENYFRYTRLAFLHHPSYLAMYFTFSIAILFGLIKENKVRLFHLLYSLGVIFFSILIFLLSPRAGLIAAFLTILIGTIWLITSKTKWILKFGLIGLIVSLTILYITISSDSDFSNKLKKDIFYNLDLKRSEYSDNYDMRFFIWQCVPNIMSHNLLFGHGTGDFHIELNREYNNRNMVEAAQNNYNAHNQFLETLISLGVIGLIVLISLIGYPSYHLYKGSDNFLPVVFLIIIIINLLAESMLSRIAGVLFFALFYSLFFCMNRKEDIL